MSLLRVAAAFSAIYWALVALNLELNRNAFTEAASGKLLQIPLSSPEGQLVYLTFFSLLVSVLALSLLKRIWALIALLPYFFSAGPLPAYETFIALSALAVASLYTRRLTIPVSVLVAGLGVYLVINGTYPQVFPPTVFFLYSALLATLAKGGASLKSYEVSCEGERATVRLKLKGKVERVEVGGVVAQPKGDHYEAVLNSYGKVEVYSVKGKRRTKIGAITIPEPLKLVVNQVGDSVNVQVFQGTRPEDPDRIEAEVDGNKVKVRRLSKGTYRIEGKGVNYSIRASKGNCNAHITLTVALPKPAPNPTPPVVAPSNANARTNTFVGRSVYGYTVVKEIGEGGFSRVYLVEKGGKKFAMKIPKLEYLRGSPDASMRMAEVLGEVTGLASTLGKNPYLVSLEGVYVDRQDMADIIKGNTSVYFERPPAIIMELQEGGTIYDVMNRDEVFLSDYWHKIVFFVAWKVAEALSYIHRNGFVHSDVKPQNIYLSSSPPRSAKEMFDYLLQGRVIPKLGDLGNAVRANGSPMGFTPQYASLEQVIAICKKGPEEGIMPVDDVYSLGATVFTLLTRATLNSKDMIDAMNAVKDCRDVEFIRANRLKLYSTRDYTPLFNALKASTFYSGKAVEITEFIMKMTAPERSNRPTANEVAKFFSYLV